jgi:hypothetical protein
MFGDRLVNPVVIVIAVCGKGSDGIRDLDEKRVNHRTIIDCCLGRFDGDDLAADRVDADMQFLPRAAARRALLIASAG